jgi:Flp pilus assembly protein TadB
VIDSPGRFAAEVAFLVVVTVILGLSNASWLLIVALAVAAPGLVLIIEARAQRRKRRQSEESYARSGWTDRR